MKAKLILLVVFVLITFQAISQKVDTIYVTAGSTVYIIFPGEIGLVDIGSKKYGHILQDNAKNVVFLKAAPTEGKGIPAPSSIFVKYGEEYYSGTIAYKEKITQNMYDFRKNAGSASQKTNPVNNTTANNNTAKNNNNTNNASNASSESKGAETASEGDDLSKKILILRDKKQQPKSLGMIENKMSVFCTNILTDKHFIYLKFSIKNNSSLDYELDFTEFNFINKKSKNLEQREPIKPVYADEKKAFPAKREVDFLYAIPVIAGTDASYFEVTFRELNGTRKITIEIPSKKVNEAETIK